MISSPTASKTHGRTQSSENMQVTWTSRVVAKGKMTGFTLITVKESDFL